MTKDQLTTWKSLEETKEFFELLTTRKEILKEHWACEGYVENERAGDRALGEIAIINSLLELTEEDFPNE